MLIIADTTAPWEWLNTVNALCSLERSLALMWKGRDEQCALKSQLHDLTPVASSKWIQDPGRSKSTEGKAWAAWGAAAATATARETRPGQLCWGAEGGERLFRAIPAGFQSAAGPEGQRPLPREKAPPSPRPGRPPAARKDWDRQRNRNLLHMDAFQGKGEIWKPAVTVPGTARKGRDGQKNSDLLHMDAFQGKEEI